MNVALVAECSSKPRPKAVSPLEGASIERIARLAGVGDATLLASVWSLRPLLEQDPGAAYSPTSARKAALEQLAELNRTEILVLLGRRTWLAFGGPASWPWFVDWPAPWRAAGGLTFAAPHPSPRCRLRSDRAFAGRELGFWRAIRDASSRARANARAA